MKHAVASFVFLASLLAGPDLVACGDKFLVVGRGTRFQRGPEAPRPYSVLVYAPQSSPLAQGRQRSSVEKALRRAGYRPATAGSAAELAETMKGRAPDVVVAADGDARDIRTQVGAETAAVVFLKSSMSTDSLLDAVDAAVSRLVSARK